MVADGMQVGLGTGSTVAYTIEALGELALDIVCVPTSERTERLARQFGMKMIDPGSVDSLDMCIDGADEVDLHLNLVKGGGGAHTREKIVASMAARFIVIVDESKLVARLGAFGVPVEALPFGAASVERHLRKVGATEVNRRDGVSDNGNLLMMASFPPIDDPVWLGREISCIPGVVEHGIFPSSMVDIVVVAGADGVRELRGMAVDPLTD